LEGPPDSDVLQHLIRRRSADGGETLEGWIRVPLAAGQRSASVHLAFCPPFAETPEVLVEPAGGPAVRIKRVQVLPYGARFDLRLADSAEVADTVVLQLSASAAGPVSKHEG
jgi:hypothetical protein